MLRKIGQGALVVAVLCYIFVVIPWLWHSIGYSDGYSDGYRAGLRHGAEMTTPNPSPSLKGTPPCPSP